MGDRTYMTHVNNWMKAFAVVDAPAAGGAS